MDRDYTAQDYIEFAEQQVGNATPAATGMLYVALAQAKALASIAESLARIADNSDSLAAWVNHTGPGK